MPDSERVVARAQQIADQVLFPRALETDASDAVPRESLDLLAREGYYGLVGPAEYGGTAVGFPTVTAVLEALAGGCLSTAFVWVQHLGALYRVAACPNQRLKDEWLPLLCAGERRGGIALAAPRPGPPLLLATEVEGGWLLDGMAPWVTGWGRIDVALTAAMTSDGRTVRALVDAGGSNTLKVRPLRLVAANASSTVEATYDSHFVPAARVTDVEPFTPPPAYDGGGRLNGSLALGVAARCVRMLGETPLERELRDRRRQLDTATDETMAVARAAAVEFAVRAAMALVVASGSRALVHDHHAQRLARESIFLLTFGTRPAIRAALLDAFGTRPE